MISAKRWRFRNFRVWGVLWREAFHSPQTRGEFRSQDFQFFSMPSLNPVVEITISPKQKVVTYEAVDQSNLVELDDERVIVSAEIRARDLCHNA